MRALPGGRRVSPAEHSARSQSLGEKNRVLRGSWPDQRVGPGGCQNLAGQVGSGQEVFEISLVGSSRVGPGGVQVIRVGAGQVGPTE